MRLLKHALGRPPAAAASRRCRSWSRRRCAPWPPTPPPPASHQAIPGSRRPTPRCTSSAAAGRGWSGCSHRTAAWQPCAQLPRRRRARLARRLRAARARARAGRRCSWAGRGRWRRCGAAWLQGAGPAVGSAVAGPAPTCTAGAAPLPHHLSLITHQAARNRCTVCAAGAAGGRARPGHAGAAGGDPAAAGGTGAQAGVLGLGLGLTGMRQLLPPPISASQPSVQSLLPSWPAAHLGRLSPPLALGLAAQVLAQLEPGAWFGGGAELYGTGSVQGGLQVSRRACIHSWHSPSTSLLSAS
jgi:hypothetical protein